MSSILAAHHIKKSYSDGQSRIDVLRKVNLDVAEGEILIIRGRSGSGKSTLLHILGLLDTPSEGTLTYGGRDLASLGAGARAQLRNAEFGFVFQQYHLLPEFTALENAVMPALIGGGMRFWWPREAKKNAIKYFEKMELSDRIHLRAPKLSGGEKQRVAIIRALINDPGIVFCDEPTGNLDAQTAARTKELLWKVAREETKTLVVVTHDEKMAQEADRVMELRNGALHGG